jgi:hypothetical protein
MDIRFEKIPTNHQALKDYSSKLRLFTLKQQERIAELEKSIIKNCYDDFSESGKRLIALATKVEK